MVLTSLPTSDSRCALVKGGGSRSCNFSHSQLVYIRAPISHIRLKAVDLPENARTIAAGTSWSLSPLCLTDLVSVSRPGLRRAVVAIAAGDLPQAKPALHISGPKEVPHSRLLAKEADCRSCFATPAWQFARTDRCNDIDERSSRRQLINAPADPYAATIEAVSDLLGMVDPRLQGTQLRAPDYRGIGRRVRKHELSLSGWASGERVLEFVNDAELQRLSDALDASHARGLVTATRLGIQQLESLLAEMWRTECKAVDARCPLAPYEPVRQD